MNEKELGKTGIMANVSCPNPKDAQHCRRVQRDSPRSVRAAWTGRGTWAHGEGSVLTIKMIVQLPRMETVYTKHSGMEIQVCDSAQARNATSRKVEDMLLLFSRDLNGIVCGGKGRLGLLQIAEMN